ncbi:Origin of replication complex subunit 5 [Linum perenne]
MADNEGGEENKTRGNDWEVVSLTASTYAAAPGPKEVEMNDDNDDYLNKMCEAETSSALFMSGHFVFPPSQHENLPLEPYYSEIMADDSDGKKVDSGYHVEEGNISGGKDDGTWPLKGLNVSEEYPDVQFFDSGSNQLTVSGKEFEESEKLHDLHLIDSEESIYSTAAFSSSHSETGLGGSIVYGENLGSNESVDQGSHLPVDNSYLSPDQAKEGKYESPELPCEAWWKKRAVSLYGHAKETNTFWSVFVAAAVMGLVILGQQWQQERWQVLQLKWQATLNSSSPDTYYSSMGYIEPIPVFFPEYSEEDLRQVLIRNQSNQKLFGWFLDIVLRPFCRVTRRLDELSPVFSSLFQKYCEPLSDTRILPNDEVKRRLFSSFQPYISPYLNDIFWGPSHSFLGGDSGKVARHEIDFHMSTSAKYLLISAFLASRNPATLDASLFDSTGGSDNRKRKRKASEKSMEQKESAEQESLMKGPGTFPLERLLAIFQCITSVTDLSLDEDEHGDGCSTEEGSNSLMSNVLLQLSTLCNANFIVKGASCPLEGSTRYRCTISEDLALKVARSMKFALPNYLYRR